MVASPKVFVDTNVLKFSATDLLRLRPRMQQLQWGNKQIDVVVHDFVRVNPNDKIRNPELKAEAELLPALAELGKQGRVQFITQTEAEQESWGLPNMDSRKGRFYGAPITWTQGPFKYSRVIAGGNMSPRDLQLNFLKSIDHPRFTQLMKITGAYQGANELNCNQLLDAFHLWCAEHESADYFLTLDFKLARVVSKAGTRYRVPIVRPSELLTRLRTENAPDTNAPET